MTQEEIIEILQAMREAGMKFEICDTPVPYYPEGVSAANKRWENHSKNANAYFAMHKKEKENEKEIEKENEIEKEKENESEKENENESSSGGGKF